MNFDFMSNLEGINRAYVPCKDAEELAYTKPYLSMTASRKSAELLAKFIYLVAHSNEMEDMPFVEILSDYTTKNYIQSSKVMDAFHYIRKNGNKAVHAVASESAEDAITVLRNLHYVAGEIAKRLGLISSYPDFNDAIDEYPNSEYHEIHDIAKIAREMFCDYIAEYRLSILQAEYAAYCSPFQFINGTITLHEYVEFTNKPEQAKTILELQEYFGYLTMNAIKNRYDPKENQPSLDFHASLTIYGGEEYATKNLFEFMDGITNRLPSACHFVIDSYYEGPNTKWDNITRIQLQQLMENLLDSENFTYKISAFYYNHGEFRNEKIHHGEWVDISKDYTQDIIFSDFGIDWWCWNIDLVVDFDFSKYPDILNQLQDAVRRNIPSDQLEYCENSWKSGELQILISSIQWNPRKLCTVQEFLDEINMIIQPIMSECECYALGQWVITDGEFAVATWDWFQDGFKVVGTKY